jgi:hypothetical protein
MVERGSECQLLADSKTGLNKNTDCTKGSAGGDESNVV